MAAKPTWLFWVRGTLLSAICGHWIANTILDARQYTDVGLEYTWRASLPVAIQTLLLVMVAALLGPLARHTRVGAARPRPWSRPRLLALLTAAQLFVFVLLEVSERLVQREPFVDGLFSSGFGFELVFAIGSVLVLAALGSVAIRVIRSLRRRATTVNAPDGDGLIPQRIPPTRTDIVVGDVRAPPLSSGLAIQGAALT